MIGGVVCHSHIINNHQLYFSVIFYENDIIVEMLRNNRTRLLALYVVVHIDRYFFDQNQPARQPL